VDGQPLGLLVRVAAELALERCGGSAVQPPALSERKASVRGVSHHLPPEATVAFPLVSEVGRQPSQVCSSGSPA
jgi:hypothetical protein